MEAEAVEHFSHPDHRLTTRNKDKDEEVTCNMCKRAVTSPTMYSCREEACEFNLHEECFHLPPEIKVTFHGNHWVLELSKSSRRDCKICKKEVSGFGYCCRNWLCMFEVHIWCVTSAPCFTNKASREHQFERIPESVSCRSLSYTCEACGLDSDDVDLNPDPHYVSYVPYKCKFCHIFVHGHCLELPGTVRIRQHPKHRISHTYFLGEEEGNELDDGSGKDEEVNGEERNKEEAEQENENEEEEEEERIEENENEEEEEEERIEENENEEEEEEERIDKKCCGVCDAKMDFEHGGYRCRDCGFVCHSKCTEGFVIIEDEEFEEDDFDPDEPSFVVIRESLVEDGQGKKMVIEEMKHFSHRHNLILFQDINEQTRDGTDAKCECCSRPIQICFSSAPSCYGCPVPGCDFYMHTSCATLPRQIRVLNKCSATLMQSDRVWQCNICDEHCNGFVYYYKMIQENYCIQCSRLLQCDSIKHRGHRHARGSYRRIFLASGRSGHGSFDCVACGKHHEMNLNFFTCSTCNFCLDMKCAALPFRVKPPDGKYDDHDLILTCRPLPSDSYQSYCLVCEEERNPARWFYYCSLCDFSAHVECALGKYPRVKFGGLYKFSHPHHLTLVHFKDVEKHPPSCHQCEKHDFDNGFQCTASECEYVMCLDCSLDE